MMQFWSKSEVHEIRVAQGGGFVLSGWLLGEAARRAAARRAGWMDLARPFFLKNLAGRLASQPCIWIHPSILELFLLVLVYY